LRDELSRLSASATLRTWGSEITACGVWLDPQKMTVRKLSAGDVIRTIEQQNARSRGADRATAVRRGKSSNTR